MRVSCQTARIHNFVHHGRNKIPQHNPISLQRNPHTEFVPLAFVVIPIGLVAQAVFHAIPSRVTGLSAFVTRQQSGLTGGRVPEGRLRLYRLVSRPDLKLVTWGRYAESIRQGNVFASKSEGSRLVEA